MDQWSFEALVENLCLKSGASHCIGSIKSVFAVSIVAAFTQMYFIHPGAGPVQVLLLVDSLYKSAHGANIAEFVLQYIHVSTGIRAACHPWY
jgi:hypothetical protein